MICIKKNQGRVVINAELRKKYPELEKERLQKEKYSINIYEQALGVLWRL